jgi:hypothetical protein
MSETLVETELIRSLRLFTEISIGRLNDTETCGRLWV